jgi:hypothetical protein
MREGVDVVLQLVEAAWQIVDRVELISPGRLSAFDEAVEIWPLGRQGDEFQRAAPSFIKSSSRESFMAAICARPPTAI